MAESIFKGLFGLFWIPIAAYLVSGNGFQKQNICVVYSTNDTIYIYFREDSFPSKQDCFICRNNSIAQESQKVNTLWWENDHLILKYSNVSGYKFMVIKDKCPLWPNHLSEAFDNDTIFLMCKSDQVICVHSKDANCGDEANTETVNDVTTGSEFANTPLLSNNTLNDVTTGSEFANTPLLSNNTLNDKIDLQIKAIAGIIGTVLGVTIIIISIWLIYNKFWKKRPLCSSIPVDSKLVPEKTSFTNKNSNPKENLMDNCDDDDDDDDDDDNIIDLSQLCTSPVQASDDGNFSAEIATSLSSNQASGSGNLHAEIATSLSPNQASGAGNLNAEMATLLSPGSSSFIINMPQNEHMIDM